MGLVDALDASGTNPKALAAESLASSGVSPPDCDAIANVSSAGRRVPVASTFNIKCRRDIARGILFSFCHTACVRRACRKVLRHRCGWRKLTRAAPAIEMTVRIY